jgi:hypothetical protein
LVKPCSGTPPHTPHTSGRRRTEDVKFDEFAGGLGKRVGSVGLDEVDLGLESCDGFQEVEQSRLVRLDIAKSISVRVRWCVCVCAVVRVQACALYLGRESACVGLVEDQPANQIRNHSESCFKNEAKRKRKQNETELGREASKEK